MNPHRVVCPHCERSRLVRPDGKVRKHGSCPGSLADHRGMHVSPLTAGITDAQISGLRMDPTTTLDERAECARALNDFGMHPASVVRAARARCAEILKTKGTTP